MSHTYEKISGNKAKLSFVIPAEQFAEATQKAFLKLRNRINVPGFRRGKAPRKIIETLYGASVFFDDALEALFPDVYQAAVKEFGLKPVDRPDVKVDEIELGKDLKFHVEVFVRPDVTLGEYKNLTVEVEQQKVTDEMINARIAEDQEKASRTLDIDDRPVQEGDTVNLNYAGSVDGVPFAGGTADNQTLTIGSHQFIPGFEEQMIGMEIGGEKDLQVKFPEDYHAEELKGKDAVFHVKVNGIQVTEKPELDDDFAADVSDFETFDEYKANIVRELTEQIDKNNDTLIKNALVEKAAENAEVDIPQAMIEDEAELLVRQMAMRMSYQGLRMEDYLKYTGQTLESLQQMYMPEAKIRVKNDLVLEAIRKEEKIEPSEEEIEKEIAEQAEQMGQDVETFKKSLTDEQKEYLKDSAAIRLVLEMLKQGATIEEKKPEAEEKEEKPAKKPSARKAEKKTEEAAEKEDKPAKKSAAKKSEKSAEEDAEAPLKKPAAKKTEKTEKAAEEGAEKPARKPAAKKTTKAKETDAE